MCLVGEMEKWKDGKKKLFGYGKKWEDRKCNLYKFTIISSVHNM